MKLVVLERTFSPELAAPTALDHWMQVNYTLDSCLEARQVSWLYSLVSVNGDRSICLFQAPYTEAVREACRQAQMPFQQIWTAELLQIKPFQSFAQGTSLIVVETNYNPPITKATIAEIKHQATGCLNELNIQSAFSALTLDGTHSACTFSASSAEQVRSLFRKMEISFASVWKATLIQSVSTKTMAAIS